MLPFCRDEGIGVIPWSPLARGFLAGNRQRGRRDATPREQHDEYGHLLYYQDADYAVVDRVAEVAAARGVRPIQVALAWVMRQPGITAPIIGASRLEQLDQLVEAASLVLTDEEARTLEAPYQPHRVLGH
jgi:aryl-alcohol dehydrogenase (NADP+)